MLIQSKKAALAKLELTPEQLITVPIVTPHLDQIMSALAARSLPSDIYYYLEASPEPDVRKILHLRKLIPKRSHKYFTLEMFCAAAGADPHEIVQSVIRTVDRLNRYNASLRISSAQPEVVQKTIDVAMTPEGDRARELYMKVSGLLPTSKGNQTTIQLTQNANANSTPQVVIVQAPPPESTIRRLADRLNASRQLAQQVQVVESVPSSESVQDAILVEKDH